MTPATVALIDDDPALLCFMQEVLSEAGYRVLLWMSAGGAAAMLLRERPALVTLDLGMERPLAGLEVLRAMRREQATRRVPVLICSADDAYLRERGDELRGMGCATLEKPFVPEELVEAVSALVPVVSEPWRTLRTCVVASSTPRPVPARPLSGRSGSPSYRRPPPAASTCHELPQTGEPLEMAPARVRHGDLARSDDLPREQ